MELFFQTKQNAADGTVTFDAIAYTEAMIGTHKYTVKEVVPADQANIQYDEGQVDVTVTVTKDEASNAIKRSLLMEIRKPLSTR